MNRIVQCVGLSLLSLAPVTAALAQKKCDNADLIGCSYNPNASPWSEDAWVKGTPTPPPSTPRPGSPAVPAPVPPEPASAPQPSWQPSDQERESARRELEERERQQAGYRSAFDADYRSVNVAAYYNRLRDIENHVRYGDDPILMVQMGRAYWELAQVERSPSYAEKGVQLLLAARERSIAEVHALMALYTIDRWNRVAGDDLRVPEEWYARWAVSMREAVRAWDERLKTTPSLSADLDQARLEMLQQRAAEHQRVQAEYQRKLDAAKPALIEKERVWRAQRAPKLLADYLQSYAQLPPGYAAKRVALGQSALLFADWANDSAARTRILKMIAQDRGTARPDSDIDKEFPTKTDAEVLAEVRAIAKEDELAGEGVIASEIDHRVEQEWRAYHAVRCRQFPDYVRRQFHAAPKVVAEKVYLAQSGCKQQNQNKSAMDFFDSAAASLSADDLPRYWEEIAGRAKLPGNGGLDYLVPQLSARLEAARLAGVAQ